MSEVNGQYKIYNEDTAEYVTCFLETKAEIVHMAGGSNVEEAVASLGVNSDNHLNALFPHFSINANNEKVKYALTMENGAPFLLYEISGA